MEGLIHPCVQCIVGATASGKSALALAKAREMNGVIINGDSLQVYADLPLLTAQPTLEDKDAVPHRLYGFLQDPHQSYSVALWREAALKAIGETFATGCIPFVVGGTGLYFKALLEGLSPIPESDPQIRSDLRAQSQTPEGLREVYAQLKTLDPEEAERLKATDAQRLVRALEVILGTGKPLRYWQSIPSEPLPYAHEITYVDLPRPVLVERARQRLVQMFEGGAIEEVAALLQKGLDDHSPLRKAIGLGEIEKYLQGNISKDEALASALIATRQYIKRQQTWFNHQLPQE